MSSAGANNKKRKKPDSKPQSQLAKSLNEKRRRELENVFIEELAELISASFADMSSLAVKPDKCAILQETVNQIRNIREQEAAATIDAVQQGEVSSSKPTILANEVFGPLLLEALEGFLFVVNSEGKVEFVTDNISMFIRYSKEEVLGKSVYNIIHHGDHGRFSSCLLPSWSSIESSGQSAGSGSSGGSTSGTAGSNPAKNRTFNCRFLVKPPDNPDQTIEEKQQRISTYETMQVVQISSTQLAQWAVGGGGGDKDDEGNDSGPCLFVARRPMPNEKHAGTPIEQFTMKIDTQGKVLAIDTTGVSYTYLHYLNKDLIGRSLEDLVHSGDLNKVVSHVKDTITLGQATSSIYRIRLMAPNSLQEKYIHVQTKSKYFKTPNIHEPEFIMATHSIIGDNELALTMTDSNSPASLGSSSTQPPSANESLLASVNGAQPSVSTRGLGGSSTSNPPSTPSNPATTSELSNTITLSNSSAFQSVTLNSNDLDFGFDMFPSSTWGEITEERPPWERTESRSSLTPAPSPLAPAPTTPFGHSTAFPFSPQLLDDKEPPGEDNANNNTVGGPSTNPGGPSLSGGAGSGGGGDVLSGAGGGSSGSNPCRLRNLLMTKRESTDSESGPGSVGAVDGATATRNRNRILKTLLNQDEDETPASASDQSPLQAKPPNNIMLLKLLNEKSDDDDGETRAGQKKQNELLQQLLKEDEANQDSKANEDPLLKSLGFRSVSASPAESIGRGRKRPSSEDAPGSGGSQQPQAQHQPQQQQIQQPLTPQQLSCVDSGGPSGPKRPSLLDSVPPSTASVTSTGKLWEKNRMLASLLAKQPSTPATIPPIPASVISATPQDKLPRLVKHPPPAWSGGSMQQQSQAPQHQQSGSGMPPQSPGGQSQRHSAQQAGQSSSLASPDYRWGGDESSSDPYLSHILDQVIEIVPDAVTDSPALMSVINSIESSSGGVLGASPFQQDLINEKMAISAIQKSLMQCESAVKPPTFNTSQLSGGQGGQQFPPPPVYTQRQRLQHPGQLRQSQYSHATQQQQLILQQRNKLIQQQQKQRLLQMQRQQEMLIPSNAAASSTDPGIHNIDSLMNNTVAPNVSLQRSASVPESQLSPPVNSYVGNTGAPTGNPLMGSSGSQISPGQRQPYSPQPFSPVNGGISSFQGAGSGGGGGQQGGQGQTSRLSPSSLQNFQQAQLSPRLSQGQQGYGTAQTQSTSWSQQQANRISIQQQQNPMLNAQLTGGNYTAGAGRTFNAGTPPSSIVTGSTTGGVVTVSSATGTVVTGSAGGNRNSGNAGQGLPSVRSLPSPGPRQSPYGNDGSGNVPPNGGGAPSAGPGGGGGGGPGGGVGPPGSSGGGGPSAASYQQFRIQRSISTGAQPTHQSAVVVPQATTHVPGGPPGGRLGSYKEQMQGYQVHQHHHHQHHQHHGVPHPHYSRIQPPPPPPHPSHHAMSYHHPSPPPPHPPPQQPGSGGSPSSPFTDGYRPHPAGGNNGMTEYVKHELRAMVGARTGGGGGGGSGMRGAPGVSTAQQQVSLASHSLDTLGISFEVQSQDSPKNMWSNMTDMGSGSPQPASIGSRQNTLEDVSRSNDQKSSLLQKLLSE